MLVHSHGHSEIVVVCCILQACSICLTTLGRCMQPRLVRVDCKHAASWPHLHECLVFAVECVVLTAQVSQLGADLAGGGLQCLSQGGLVALRTAPAGHSMTGQGEESGRLCNLLQQPHTA